MKMRLYQSFFIIMLVILLVLVIITTVIRNFNGQIVKLVDEHQMMFKKATEELYDSIYELNLTKNCYVGEPTEKYFSSLGAGKMPFDEGLRAIAKKQIKEEFREGYVQMFTPKNAIREFESGNNHLSYDFMITEDGINYHWTRVETLPVFSQEDQSVHMFSYRKNIDSEKKKELMAKQDGMTGFYTKITTETLIQKQLSEHPENRYAFIIFDIDNFKQINDRYGHAFGDYCITCFTQKYADISGNLMSLAESAVMSLQPSLSVPSKILEKRKKRQGSFQKLWIWSVSRMGSAAISLPALELRSPPWGRTLKTYIGAQMPPYTRQKKMGKMVSPYIMKEVPYEIYKQRE